jgi:hypothetical protein
MPLDVQNKQKKKIPLHCSEKKEIKSIMADTLTLALFSNQ